MREVARKVWSYSLYENNEDFVLNVICGTVGLYEMKISLNENEKSEFNIRGVNFINELARSIQSEPEKYKSRTSVEIKSSTKLKEIIKNNWDFGLYENNRRDKLLSVVFRKDSVEILRDFKLLKDEEKYSFDRLKQLSEDIRNNYKSYEDREVKSRLTNSFVSDVNDSIKKVDRPTQTHIKFTEKFDSTEGYILKFEEKNRITIPNGYRTFLIENGGGIPDKYNYYEELESGGVYDFEISAFYGNSPNELSLDLDHNYIMMLGLIPRQFLCIADDGIGNYVCIGLNGVYTNKIYLLEDTEEELLTHFVQIKDTLVDFIRKLK